MSEHVVSVSSGVASAFTWHLAIEEQGVDNVVGLFADVNGEDVDNYRFLAEVTEHLGARLVTLDNGGRTIWDSMREQRFLANSRIDTCSKFLKRKPIMDWLKTNTLGAAVWLGFDWTEEGNRLARPAAAYAAEGFTVRCPMIERLLDKADALTWLASIGIEPPALTREGFPHANCRGGCVKAGAKHFKRLLRDRPADFAWWEENERAMRSFLDADVSILRDRRGGDVKPLTLEEMRLLTHRAPSLFDDDDAAPCGCFMAEDMA